MNQSPGSDLLAKLNLRLEQAGLFSSLPPEVRNEIVLSATFRTFRKGEVIAHELSKPSKFILLLEGSVEISRPLPDGNRTIFRTLHPPSGIGYLLLSGQAHTADVVAFDSALVALIPVSVLKRAFDKHTELLYKIISRMAGLVDELSSELIEQRTLSLRERLHAAISRNADARGELRMSHEELARLVGATRANVTRSLKALAGAGIITLGRQVIRVEPRPPREKSVNS